MKSDGTDQMNTVAKTAEYPLERLALLRAAESAVADDVLWLISSLIQTMLNGCSVHCPQCIEQACRAQIALARCDIYLRQDSGGRVGRNGAYDART
jgi:hypothetical protein